MITINIQEKLLNKILYFIRYYLKPRNKPFIQLTGYHDVEKQMHNKKQQDILIEVS